MMMERMGTTMRARDRRGRGGIVLSLRLHHQLLVFVLCLLLGMLFGSMTPAFMDFQSFRGISQVLQAFLTERQGQTMAATFFSALLPNAIFWLILLLCGFCAVSTPLILLIPFAKGLGYGLFASALISQYGLSTLHYLMLSVLPNLLISSITLLFCCRDAQRMSRSIWQMMQPQARSSAEEQTAGEFGAKMILYGVFLCLGAALEAYFCASSLIGLL